MTMIPTATQARIEQIIKEHPLVLFMKGNRQFPMCGFSARAVEILGACGIKNLFTVDVLADNDIREAIKVFSDWPTIPQLYLHGEFIGGADIIQEMYQAGELQALLAGA